MREDGYPPRRSLPPKPTSPNCAAFVNCNNYDSEPTFADCGQMLAIRPLG
jgi:hypothetical protein